MFDAITARPHDRATLTQHISFFERPLTSRLQPPKSYLHPSRTPPALKSAWNTHDYYGSISHNVKAIYQRYLGWYDGNPAHLKPAPERALAEEVAALAGGPARLADRAQALAAAGEMALACHLIEMAAQAAPGDAAIWAMRAEVYRRRSASERSLMARGIFAAAADECMQGSAPAAAAPVAAQDSGVA